MAWRVTYGDRGRFPAIWVVCPATRRLRRPTQSIRYRTGTAGWTRPRRWLDQAAAAGVLGRAQKGAALAAVTQAAALVETALAAGPGFLLAHRDASARNILITDRGPVLLDYAGPEVPWWEFVHHCFDLASPFLGRQPPRPDLVRAALTAYMQAGAVAGPAGPEAFAGLLRAALGSLAYNIWLAVGDRPASGARRAAAVRDTQEVASVLPSILDSLGPWSRLIR